MSNQPITATDQTDGPVQVIIIIICYNGRADTETCLRSLFTSNDDDINKRVVVVDNNSTDGTVEFVTTTFPQVDLCVESINRGYAGGANAGWNFARQKYPDARFLVLLNQDTLVHNKWLVPLVDFLQQHDHVGIVGPKILLHPETDKINTIGNRSHFLGFGFVTGYGQIDHGRFIKAHAVDFVSGAALMVRTDLLAGTDLFNEELFMYLEDAELAWKLHQVGYQSYVQPTSVIEHCYHPAAPLKHYYYLERNRWILLWVYYKLPTLLLLIPALLFMELGQIAYATMNGKLCDKLRSYGYFLRPINWARLWKQRRYAQRHRTETDRQFMTRFSGTFDHVAVNGLLLRYIGNPLLQAYWWVARRMIIW